MEIINSIYPYPVLSIDDDDYTGSVFDVEYSSNEATPNNFKLDYIIKDKGIESLIESGKAGLYLHIEVSRSGYRQLVEVDSKTKSYLFKVDPSKMIDEVELTPFVLVKKTVKNFVNPGVNHELYGDDYIFPTLEVGDPLAVSFTRKIMVSESEDTLNNIPSIISIAKSTKNKVMTIETEADTVYVYLPEKQYDAYVELPDYADITISMIITPVLIQLLNIMIQSRQNRADEYDEWKWFKVIENKIQGLGLTIEEIEAKSSVFEVAQQILDNPMERSFDMLRGLVSDYED